MKTILTMTDERYQTLGVAVYADAAEVRADAAERLDRTIEGTPYLETADVVLTGDDAIATATAQMLEAVDYISVPDNYQIPTSGYYHSWREFNASVNALYGIETDL